MASAIIDPAVVHRMLARLMEAVAAINSGITILQLGEPWEEVGAWARLEGFSLTTIPRQREGSAALGEEHQAKLVANIVGGVSAAKTRAKSSAISTVTGAVMSVFDGAHVRDPETGTPVIHQLNFIEFSSDTQGTNDPEPGVQQVFITASGTCERHSGTSMSNDL